MIRIEYISERIENLTSLRAMGFLVPVKKFKGRTRTLLSTKIMDKELHTLATISLQRYKLMYLEHMFKCNSDKVLEVLDNRPYVPSYFKDMVREIVSKLLEHNFECFTTVRNGNTFSFILEIKNENNHIPAKVRSVFEIQISLPNLEGKLDTNHFSDSILGSKFVMLTDVVIDKGGTVDSKRVEFGSNIINYSNFTDKQNNSYLECTVKTHSLEDKPKGKHISGFDMQLLLDTTVTPSKPLLELNRTFSMLTENDILFYITETENGFCITAIESGKLQIEFYFKTLMEFNYVY